MKNKNTLIVNHLKSILKSKWVKALSVLCTANESFSGTQYQTVLAFIHVKDPLFEKLLNILAVSSNFWFYHTFFVTVQRRGHITVLFFGTMFCWHTETRANYWQKQRSQSPDFHGSCNGSKKYINYKAHRSLITARSLRQLSLSCCTAKTLNPCSVVSLWIMPALLCLPPSLCLLLFLLFLPCEHWCTGTDEWGSSTPELKLSAPRSCTLERRKAGLHIICFIFYFCFITRGTCRRVCSVVFFMHCYISFPPMHTSQEQLWF